jgi:hypothetical protein
MGESQGTSALNLYNSNPAGAQPGSGMAQELAGRDMEIRQKMVAPTPGADMSRPSGAPEWYNYAGMQPAKYSMPNEMKDRMVARAAIREAAQDVGTAAVPRPDPIGDDEVSYLQSMQKQADLADFDRYVNTLVDPRKPGNLKWLMEVYPEYVSRRVSQVHDDYDFAIRNQMIDMYGVNTFDDLHFKYLVDQGRVSGPSLSRPVVKDAQYKAGWLSPWQHYRKEAPGVQLPFSSAQTGARPSNRTDWTQSDRGQPLAGERGLRDMARNVMDVIPDRHRGWDGSGGAMRMGG